MLPVRAMLFTAQEITLLAVRLAVGASCCPAFHRLALQQFTGMLCSAALYSATAAAAAAAFPALLLWMASVHAGELDGALQSLGLRVA